MCVAGRSVQYDACEEEDVGGVLHPVGGRGHSPRLHLRTGLPPAHLPRQQGIQLIEEGFT